MSGMDIGHAADISSREDAGQLVHMRDAEGELAYEDGKPVTVRIAGSYSALYRRTQAAQTQRMLKRRQTLTPELLEANRIELVAACILPDDWQGWTNAGKPLPYSRDNATRIASVPWIQAQLEEAQQDHAGFSPKPSAS